MLASTLVPPPLTSNYPFVRYTHINTTIDIYIICEECCESINPQSFWYNVYGLGPMLFRLHKGPMNVMAMEHIKFGVVTNAH